MVQEVFKSVNRKLVFLALVSIALSDTVRLRGDAAIQAGVAPWVETAVKTLVPVR
jgi:hypothetical protein